MMKTLDWEYRNVGSRMQFDQDLYLFKHNQNKFPVRLHGEYNILVKLCGNTT